MRIKDLRSLQSRELTEKLQESYKELMKENTQIAIGTQIKNPGKVKQLKKTIAKIKMITHNNKRVAKQ